MPPNSAIPDVSLKKEYTLIHFANHPLIEKKDESSFMIHLFQQNESVLHFNKHKFRNDLFSIV